MDILEIALTIVLTLGIGYVVLLLVLEGVIWKVQPEMEGGVTLHVNTGDTTIKRRLYGLEYDNKLYVSSNHWFRKWYYAILENPHIEVERAGKVGAYTAQPIEGDEHNRVVDEYNMGFTLRLLCGFAPQRFLRLDPRETRSDT